MVFATTAINCKTKNIKRKNTHVNKYVGIIDLQQKTLFANLGLIRQALKIVNTRYKDCVTCPFPAFLTFQY